MNLTGGVTFLTVLIKCAKSGINKKTNFPRETKRRIRKVEINNGWNTQIVQIFHDKRDGGFIFKVNLLSRP